jgi:hypothetical protein
MSSELQPTQPHLSLVLQLNTGVQGREILNIVFADDDFDKVLQRLLIVS